MMMLNVDLSLAFLVAVQCSALLTCLIIAESERESACGTHQPAICTAALSAYFPSFTQGFFPHWRQKRCLARVSFRMSVTIRSEAMNTQFNTDPFVKHSN